MSFQSFKNKWMGERVDADGAYQYQCVDLIRQYFAEERGLAKTGAWGNAIDYWRSPVSHVLAVCDKIPGSNAIEGDIVVLNGLAGNPYGHIGIATGNINARQVEILEQNGSTGNGSGTGGDAIRTRYVDRSRAAGLLRLKPIGGSIVTLTEADVRELYREIFGREGDAGGVKNYTGKTLQFALRDMISSQEFRNRHVKEVVKEVPIGTAASADQILGGELVAKIRQIK
jgi:hypothetical protein